jgi:cytochrome c peroxidase
MGRAASLPALLRTLAADDQYRLCFDVVFGPGGLTLGNVARALAQFERSLTSADTRWDRVRRGEAVLSSLEAAGERTFDRACARCHAPPLFTDDAYHQNGLDSAFPPPLEAEARGRARISRNRDDLGKYRTPTLRAIARSAPYMHDGRLDTLGRVIDHYRSGMKDSPTLDPDFRRDGEAPGVSLTNADARALEAFLRTLD